MTAIRWTMGQLGLDDLLQRPGELGVAAEAQFIGEPDDGRLADADGGAHLSRVIKAALSVWLVMKSAIRFWPLEKVGRALCNLIQNIH